MHQKPEPGSGIVLYKGDVIEFSLRLPDRESRCGGAWVRTTVGNAAARRREVIANAERGCPILHRDWHDIPMRRAGDRFFVATVPLLEVGRFEAKTFFLPADTAEPIWPEGDNIVIKVEPAECCCRNTIYTAFVRQFGPRTRSQAIQDHEQAIKVLEDDGYSVIPRSGTFRNLIRELDFIIGKLRFQIIQLLPIHPVPTTYARMGRFGSPYAALDFRDVDPALAEFDRKTTPLDQFGELVDAVHQRDARIFLDIPANHTGWASKLQVERPEWFDRDKDMKFRSPGAWGVTWEDLAKLDYEHRELWKEMADIFLFWARRGVDGFRCDAGYMIPVRAWQYIVARVRDEYPDTVFLLEGLGGKPETVRKLLDHANLDWAYSELFQNYNRAEVETCLLESGRLSETIGLFVHYAETHDNNRLAARSRSYARMRTALSALCSQAGAFGITNGVEWFAEEKINVHEARSINWGGAENQLEHIRRLNTILAVHPAFCAGAGIRLVQQGGTNAIALLRGGADARESLLVLANLEEVRTTISWKAGDFSAHDKTLYDLLSGNRTDVEQSGSTMSCSLDPGAVLCLAQRDSDVILIDNALRDAQERVPDRRELQRARAKALEVCAFFENDSVLDMAAVDEKTRLLLENPAMLCTDADATRQAHLVFWEWPRDLKRIVMLPPRCFLLVKCNHKFVAELCDGDRQVRREKSICGNDKVHFVLFTPIPNSETPRKGRIELVVFEPGQCRRGRAPVLFPSDWRKALVRNTFTLDEVRSHGSYAICANRLGAMAQVRGAWGEVRSQYDAMLAGNLDPNCPVDRRVMLTRCRAWMVYQGYSQAIDLTCLDAFSADGRACWNFIVSAGQGKKVPLEFMLKLRRDENGAQLILYREESLADGDYMANNRPVKLILRPDIEDRINHEKTKAYKGAETAWPNAISAAENGFVFSPSTDRRLKMTASSGKFVFEPEWSYAIAHPEDGERGFDDCSDLFSPGYFMMTLQGGESVEIDAEIVFAGQSEKSAGRSARRAAPSSGTSLRRLDEAMRDAMLSFIVKRGALKTVIAGYPWFLDWGRDALICLRGMISAGMIEEARAILRQFGRFELRGTLPNMMSGDNDANRDTSDAPLWFCVACSDLVRREGDVGFLEKDCGGRNVREVLGSIVEHYMKGTPNGVGMDPESGLVFSPAHFSWMDTNYPAGTPREGYPIEIQALWHAALSFMAELDAGADRWRGLVELVGTSIKRYFAGQSAGWLADCLHAAPGSPARDARADDALRPNQLLAITLGAVTDMEVKLSVVAGCQELIVPGGIRSLADRDVDFSQPIFYRDRLLNKPTNPYFGVYLGDEDTGRKPAYHNGTAWTWLFPSYSEALYMACGKEVLDIALAILSSSSEIINEGCAGHVPEILDGDSPHKARGCGAQAWGAAELYRVLDKLRGAAE